MLKVSKVRELPVNLKPSFVNEIYLNGNKLLLHFKEDTILGDVAGLVDVTNENMAELGSDVIEKNITFKKGLKSVDGKVVVSGGESLLVQRFLYEDGECSLGVIMPCLGEYGKYELAFDLYGTGETYKMADSVEEIRVAECSLDSRDLHSNYLNCKIETLNSVISSGYLSVEYMGSCVTGFVVDTEEVTGGIRLLVNINGKYAICIKNGSVHDIILYVLRVLTCDRVVHLEDLE